MAEASYNKKMVSGILIVAGLLIFIFAAMTILRTSSLQVEGVSCGEDCPHEAQLVFLTDIIPLLVGFGIMAGAGTFYFMSQKVVAKDDLLKKNTSILLKFLSGEERVVVNKLMENHGRVYQAELTRLPELGKVKAHRTIKRLMEKGVLEKSGFGKTNVVTFSKEVKEGLL